MRDVADLVQELRHVLWLVPIRGDLYVEKFMRLHVDVDWRKPNSLRDLARALIDNQARIEACELERALQCAAELEQLAVALEAGPPIPNVDDLIARYVGGEIGDRTVLWVMDWDHWQLFEACAARHLPPVQMISTDSPETLQALAELLREARDKDGDEDKKED